MNKVFLFSPVGGTDPISQHNCKDGSLLHICRFEKPDKVFLYMSKEIMDYEKTDHRYSYCLKKLMDFQKRSFEVEIIERPDLVAVHDYNYFYTEFSGILDQIMQEMDETDTLLLNIASGTPAMKSTLAVLQTISEYSCRLIQVTTPDKAMGRHDNSGYDPELLWECNEDNKEGAENRCKDVSLPALAIMKKEEIIKMHIRAYDYQAALQVAESLPPHTVSKYIDCLRMGAARINFDREMLNKLEKKNGFTMPVKSSDAIKRFEYALILQVKQKRGECADFIRGITPLIVDLYEQILKQRYGFVVNDFCDPENKEKNIPRKWNRQKLEGTEYLRALDREYERGFHFGPVYSDHLRVIIKNISNNNDLNNLLEKISVVEQNARNLAAHDMESFDDDKLKDLTGQSSKAIMQNIRNLFGYTNYNIPKNAWDSYDAMNDFIISNI